MRIKVIFVLLILFVLTSCKKKNTVQPVDTKTTQVSKKWTILAYYVNNVSVKLADGDYLQFNSDKTYTERKYKVTVSGNWEWKENQTQISMNNGTWKVLTLSDNHLELDKLSASPPEKLVLHIF